MCDAEWDCEKDGEGKGGVYLQDNLRVFWRKMYKNNNKSIFVYWW